MINKDDLGQILQAFLANYATQNEKLLEFVTQDAAEILLVAILLDGGYPAYNQVLEKTFKSFEERTKK